MPELFGRYRIEEKLGQGGMGIVYRAFDTVLERVVALKMVVTADDMESDLRERFFREARAAAHLSHKNIVTIYDLWEHEGRPCLAMEYLAGEDLQHRLARPEKMSLWRKVDLAIEMCQGMEYAHGHGIVHRDLKPANIFITTGGSVKILDFGLARLASSQLTQSNMLMGTINYLSPEQVRGERADQQSDVFAMGVVLYELFGGRRAFEGNSAAATLYKILQEVPEPLSHADPTLPRDLISVIDRALAKPRDERYSDMATLRRDLETLRHLAQVAGPASPWPAPTPLLSGTPQPVPSMPEALASAPTVAQQPLPSVVTPARKSRTPWMAAAAVLVVIGGVAVALWLGRQRAQPPASTAAPSTAESTAATPPVRPPQPSPSTSPADAPAKAPPPPDADSSAPASAGAEAARSRMEQSRAAAEAAGARTRVKAAFTKAQRTGQEADRLFKAKQYAEAEARYYVANGLYLGAESAARESASADNRKPTATDPPPHTTTPAETKAAPSAPVAPPPQPSAPASSTASPPASAPATPPTPTPTPSPNRGSSSLPTTPIATPGAPAGAPPVSAEERVRELLDRYKEALESKNMEQLKRIWPSLKGASENGIRDNFQNATSISVEISNPQISVSGASGRVTFTRHYSLVMEDGKRPQSTNDAVMDVRRIGATWVIESIRFTTTK